MCLNNLVFHVRVPVGVFYLNMSKRGKKQDLNDDSFESYVKDCLETIRQDVKTMKYNQAKFNEDFKSFEQ